MSKKVKKGVIAAAGKGTRFLPVTKAMPKEMLPIMDKPVIQYIVEEFVEAGIEDIVIVTSWDNRAIEDHFDHTFELEEHLKRAGKTEELEEVQRLADMANFIYVRQKGPYGNGTPLLSARSAIGDEPFLYAYGDDLVHSNESFSKSMVEAYEKKPGIYLGVQNVPKQDIVKYGSVKYKQGSNEVLDIIEKPSVEDAPSTLASFGRYLLTPEIFQALKDIGLGKGDELWTADAVQHLINKGVKAYYKEVEDGKWYTTGDPINYLKALRTYAQNDPEFKNQINDIFVP